MTPLANLALFIFSAALLAHEFAASIRVLVEVQ